MSERTRLGVFVKESVLGCQRCPLHEQVTAPVPYRGPLDARLVIVGEAPGRDEDREGRPFVGSAGGLLSGLLRQAGMDEKKIVFTNTVQCFPGRMPKHAERDACRVNLMMTLDLIRPEWILTVGKVALSAFRPDLEEKLKYVRGKPMWFERYDWKADLWPTYHPAAALRSKKYVEMILEDLNGFREWGQASPEEQRWPEECYFCGEMVERYDGWGVALCARHSRIYGQMELFD